MAKSTIGQFTEFVGRRIANRRKAKKILPEDLARKVGVSVMVLDHMEHGLCNINLEQMALFARYLAPLEELFGLPHYDDAEMTAFLDKRIKAMTGEDLRAWQQDTAPLIADQHRLFILDTDVEPE
jgi:transcriptional regulator with XRE-family HTH domain